MTLDRYEPRVLEQSVREQEENGAGFAWFNIGQPTELLPPWGSHQRDIELRRLWLNAHNTIVVGAITNLIKRVVSTPWEIVGGPNLTRRFQEVFQNAEFGDGYKSWLERVLTDYYTQDFGAVIEVIGPGAQDRPLSGPVTGLAHLDRRRCMATGNYEHPIEYYSRHGKVYKLHYTRVIRLVDMPNPEEDTFGNGLCALSRVMSVTNAQILMGRYINEKLANEPPAGIITFKNVKSTDVETFKKQYAAGRVKAGTNTYAPLMFLNANDVDASIEVTFIPFAQLPDHFSYKEYMEMHVNMLALSIGVDPQDIWPLTGQALGTGAQSQILDAKGQGKALADAYQTLERAYNTWILPESLEFKFKSKDVGADQREAQTAQLWVNMSTQMIQAGQMSAEMANDFLAQRVEAFADILLDAQGKVRLPDDDPKPTNEVVAEDDTTLTTTEQPEQPTIAEDDSTLQQRLWRRLDTDGRPVVLDTQTKDFQETQTEFIRNLTELVNAGLSGDEGRRRFGTVMRAQLARLGRRAYQDGLEDGGVSVDALDRDDQAIVAAWLTEQSKYVTKFADRVFSGDSQMTPEARAEAWANKSLGDIYQRGVLEADRNGMYRWALGPAEEHCPDCNRLNRQVHRLRDWHKRDLIPRSDRLKCKMGCKCELVKTTGKARGRY